MNTLIDLDRLIDNSDLRIGVISDTHSRLNETIITPLHNCDVILHAGDIGAASVLEDLCTFTPHVYSVRGNNDIEIKWPASDLSELSKIPEEIELVFKGERIAVTHGHQYPAVNTRHQKLRARFPHADIIIYGHSHLLACDTEHKPWVINPGPGGYNRTYNGASCLVMHYKNRRWGIEQTRAEKNNLGSA